MPNCFGHRKSNKIRSLKSIQAFIYVKTWYVMPTANPPGKKVSPGVSRITQLKTTTTMMRRKRRKRRKTTRRTMSLPSHKASQRDVVALATFLHLRLVIWAVAQWTNGYRNSNTNPNNAQVYDDRCGSLWFTDGGWLQNRRHRNIKNETWTDHSEWNKLSFFLRHSLARSISVCLCLLLLLPQLPLCGPIRLRNWTLTTTDLQGQAQKTWFLCNENIVLCNCIVGDPMRLMPCHPQHF